MKFSAMHLYRFRRMGILITALILVGMVFLTNAVYAGEQEILNAPPSAKSVYAAAKDTVVVVLSRSENGLTSQGSGVVYGNGFDPSQMKPTSTWIATNAHVVGDGKQAIVRQSDRQYLAKVDYVDAELDLAILHIDDLVLPAAILAGGSMTNIGERVYAIGAPFGLESTITEGILSGVRDIGGVSLLQTSAAISSGNSGGGLFDGRARLIGITTFKVKGGENINFAVNASYIDEIRAAKTYAEVIHLLSAKSSLPKSQLERIASHRFTKSYIPHFAG